ncbi:hypothetical protein AVEN_151968-1 [Araneus ventricosus]|uniref:Uncharacterized protein n=1 Tax=Araneus ventricosus TaxID=182803 RepID=A0A4Y2FWT2_ARAVE|nr:hypothetical protein AVEN_151968-1 [Araneus ventricosus]
MQIIDKVKTFYGRRRFSKTRKNESSIPKIKQSLNKLNTMMLSELSVANEPNKQSRQSQRSLVLKRGLSGKWAKFITQLLSAGDLKMMNRKAGVLFLSYEKYLIDRCNASPKTNFHL